MAVVVGNDTAIIANGTLGTYLIDVSDSSSPSLLQRITGRTTDIALEGTTIYIIDFYTGVKAYDASNPATPIFLGRLGSNAIDWVSFSVDDAVGFAGTADEGIRTYDMSLTLNCDCSCVADMNNNCKLDFFDVSLFLTAYASLDPLADITGDGSFDFIDISAFLSSYSAGCRFSDPSE